MHNTPSRLKARGMREKAKELGSEARILMKIEGLESEGALREKMAKELSEQARVLDNQARLEDISVRQVNYWKDTRHGRQNYPRWYASWREDNRIRNAYLGSVKRMSRTEALQKAKKMKAEAFGLYL